MKPRAQPSHELARAGRLTAERVTEFCELLRERRKVLDERRRGIGAAAGPRAIEVAPANDVADTIEELAVAEEELRVQMEELQRLRGADATKDRAIGVLAHDLLTPVNVVLGWTQLLRRDLLDPKMRETALATIERNARMQADLVSLLLDSTRAAAGKITIAPAPVDFGALVRDALQSVHSRNVVIADRTSARRATVSGDEQRLRQIVTTLVTSGAKDGRVRVELDACDGHARLRVADDGPGLSPEALATLFDGVQTNAPSANALSLFVAKKLVELHGGRLEVESDGAVAFTVVLPLVDAPAQARDELAGLRVLVVEDDPDARDLTRFVLAQAGADVVATGDAASALAAFDSLAPDAVVSDLGLPGTDGRALARLLRARPRGALVAALAVSGSSPDAGAALESGFDSFLPKPASPKQIVAAVLACVRAKRS